MSESLIRNAIRTPDGTVLESTHVHDYVGYTDSVSDSYYFVDGGLDYCRRTNNGDEVSLCLWDDEPHDVQRDVIKWGTYGKNGDEPLTRVSIKDMSTDHIEAVLRECKPRATIKACMLTELLHRTNYKVTL